MEYLLERPHISESPAVARTEGDSNRIGDIFRRRHSSARGLIAWLPPVIAYRPIISATLLARQNGPAYISLSLWCMQSWTRTHHHSSFPESGVDVAESVGTRLFPRCGGGTPWDLPMSSTSPCICCFHSLLASRIRVSITPPRGTRSNHSPYSEIKIPTWPGK